MFSKTMQKNLSHTGNTLFSQTSDDQKRKEIEMYKKVSTNLNFVDREKETEKFWDDNHIFEKSMENRKEGPTYTFYDGPPIS